MRKSLRLTIILVIFSGHALAAKGKKGAPKEPASTMDQSDPAAKEQSEKKAAAPKARPRKVVRKAKVARKAKVVRKAKKQARKTARRGRR